MTTTPLLTADRLSREPEAEMAERLSAWGWPLGTAVLTITTLLLWYGRRADAALYRLMGMTTSKMTLMYATEHVLAVLVPTQIGALLAVLLVNQQEQFGPLAGRLAGYENLSLLSALAILPLAYGYWHSRRTRPLNTIKGL